MSDRPLSEVKGVWFVAAREYCRKIHGEDTLAQLIAQTPAPYRDVYAAPIPSAWYPEEALQEALSMLHEVVAQGSDVMFERILEGCTEQGLTRLFHMLLRMSSPGFVLRMVPTMWRQIRRGAGHVDVEQHDGFALVRYSEFPWFRDRLYRLLTTASLRAIVRTSSGQHPRIELLEEGRDGLFLRVAYRAHEELSGVRRASTRPPPRARAGH